VPLAALMARLDTPALADTFLTRLPDAARERLLASGTILEIRPRTVIFATHDPARIGLLLRGRARTFLSSPDQRQMTLRYIREGDLFANMAGPSAARAPVTVAAVTECVILEVDPATMIGLVEGDGRVGTALLLEMIARLQEGYATVSAMAFGSMHERVAGHLLDMAGTGPDGRFVVPVTQQQLADNVGTVREVVARVLRDLRRAGILRTAKGRMEICDPRRLAAIAGRKTVSLAEADPIPS